MIDTELDNYVICLGANTPDAPRRIADAYEFVATMGVVLRSTDSYPTLPEYTKSGTPYLNQIMVIGTKLPLNELYKTLKSYESGVRSCCEYEGLVNLDIDIVMHNSEVLRPRDYAADYFRIGMEKLDLHS